MTGTDLGKALMIIGGCLSIALLAAFLLTSYGETGKPTKLMGLYIAQSGMSLVFLVGYYVRTGAVRRGAGAQREQKT